MCITIRKYQEEDLQSLMMLWNNVVEEGKAFPQVESLTLEEAKDFFASQDYTGVAIFENEIVGLYILHPNNVGRCGHIANASYAVNQAYRGKKIGRLLVEDSLKKARTLGFKIMQFNAVVSSNKRAMHLYEKLGFKQLGCIPNGFLLEEGSYTDIYLYYKTLDEL